MKIRLIQIDDDSINNMANERLLKKMGIEFSAVNFLDPTEAIEFLSNNNDVFDLMLLDINMPRLSGWEFLERYRPLNKKIPIIMLTTSLDPNDVSMAKENNMLTGFYSKPLMKEMMLEIINKCQISN